MEKERTPLRVGIVGVGAIAVEHHLPNWLELEQEGKVVVVALCDVVRAKLEKARQQFSSARLFTDYKRMLAESALDIVDVCTQNRLHAPVSLAALEAGAHVLVEKPMAMNVKEAEAMWRTARARKRKLMVAQHMRFEAAHKKLHEAVERGELGEIYTAQTFWLRRRGIPGWGKFHIRRESLGGPLIDIGVHMLDLCLWLMGFPKPVSVVGVTYRKFGDREDLYNAEWGVPYDVREFDVEDYAAGFVRFERDITLQLAVSWAANVQEEIIQCFVLGDKAGVSISPVGIFGADKSSLWSKRFDYLDPLEGHREEIRHFVDCVLSDKPVLVRPEESIVVQRIIDGLYESARTRREVTLR